MLGLLSWQPGLNIRAQPNNCFLIQQELSKLDMNWHIGRYNNLFMETSRNVVYLKYNLFHWIPLFFSEPKFACLLIAGSTRNHYSWIRRTQSAISNPKISIFSLLFPVWDSGRRKGKSRKTKVLTVSIVLASFFFPAKSLKYSWARN